MKQLFKHLLLTTIVCITGVANASAQCDKQIFNHLSAGIHVATTGFGVELATPISNYVALRAGVSFMPGFSFNTGVDGSYTVDEYIGQQDFSMDVNASLKRTQGNVIFNIYPFGQKSTFYVAAGAYFGGGSLLKISGHSDELQEIIGTSGLESGSVNIGDYELPIDKNGNVSGTLEVNKFRPYVGLGFGRAIPKSRLNFGVELGVQFMGKMKVYSAGEEVPINELDYEDDWKKVMDKLTVYPVLKFTLSGRII